jgi:hypothetical protein
MHAYKYVSTGGGFSVLNAGTVTEVIAQDGTIKGDIKEALAQGSIYIGNSSGVTSELSVKTDTGFLVGNGTTAVVKTMSGEASMANTGAVTLANASVIGKVLTGYTSGAGTVAATDTILQAIQKLNGNFVAGIMPYVSVSTYSTTYTDSAFNVGKYGAGLEDTAATDNILASIVSTTHTDKGGSDRSSMSLFVGNSLTGAAANNKMQCILSSMDIAANCFDAYSIQGHINVSNDATATNGGSNNGNIAGISAKASVGTGKTATGTVSGLLVTMDGAGTVTGTHSGVWIDNVAATDQAILISGSNKLGINMNGISISAGAATDDAGIKTAQGATAPAGSIYISTNGTVFVMVSTTWTALTIN